MRACAGASTLPADPEDRLAFLCVPTHGRPILCASYASRFAGVWRAVMPVQLPRPVLPVETLRAALASYDLGGSVAFVDFLRPILEPDPG